MRQYLIMLQQLFINRYVSELSLIRDNHEENSKLLEQELNAKLQQKESTIRTLQTTNQVSRRNHSRLFFFVPK